MEHTAIYIQTVTEYSEEVFAAVKLLVTQLADDSHPLTEDDMRAMIANDHTCLLLARDRNTIIGMTTIIFYRIPYRKKGWIEDVVVDTAYRGKGVGKMLMQKAIEIAQDQGLTSLNLTSNPTREGANALYQKLGFEKKETNVYQLKF